MPLEGLIDVGRNARSCRTELAALEKQLAALKGRLANEGFISRRPGTGRGSGAR